MKKLVFVIPLMAISLLASCGPTTSTYTITFISNGGSLIEPLSVKKGETIDKPTDPVKENMIFYNWYANKDFIGNPYDFNTPVVGELVLYARWGYQVTFYNKGGTIYQQQITPEFTLVEPPPQPSIEYYDFDGWYTNASCEEKYRYKFDKLIEGNLSLYANFTATKYYITYPNWPEDIPNPNPTEYTHQSETITLDTTIFDDDKYKGLHFNNYLDENKNPITEIPSGSSGNKTIYLDYDADEVTIGFDANGGSLDKETFDNVYLNYCQGDTENVEITDIPQVSQSEDGYNPNTVDHLDRSDRYFAGWYLDQNYTQPLIESDSEINEVEPGSSLYAKWNVKGDDYIIANKQGATINHTEAIQGSGGINKDFYARVPFYASKVDFLIVQETPLSVRTSLDTWCMVNNFEIFRTSEASKGSFNFSYSIPSGYVISTCRITYRSGVHVIGWVPLNCGVTVTFTTSEGCYRRQLIKVKTDKGSKKVKYWDLVNVGEPSRDGYNFAGWSIDGVTPIDLGKHYQLDDGTQLKALWTSLI